MTLQSLISSGPSALEIARLREKHETDVLEIQAKKFKYPAGKRGTIKVGHSCFIASTRANAFAQILYHTVQFSEGDVVLCQRNIIPPKKGKSKKGK